MKKNILFVALGSAAIALVMNSCGNQQDVQKQTDEQNAKIQKAVDDKLNSLTYNCDSIVTVMATAKYDSLMAAEKDAHKGGTHKPTPKPKPEEPKKVEPSNPKKDKMQGNTQNNVDEKKAKMGGKTDSTSFNKKKSKMSGGK